MLYLRNDSTDPCFNLAFEEYAFRNIGLGEPVAFIWQNEPTVVIGRWQNTVEEINCEYVEKNHIHVVRRITGGGAVYHDLGNINYTFISQKEGDVFEFAKFTQPVIEALADMGVKAELSGRNDITVGGAKISGNAQYSSGGRLLHHGTILYASDLSVVSKSLQVKPDKIQSKGIKSVRSRVANIADCMTAPMPLEEFKERILSHLLQDNKAERYELSAQEMEKVRRLADEKYRSWEWVYGQSPKFNLQKRRKFPFGEVDVRMQVEHGIIQECTVFGDFFSNEDPNELCRRLVGSELRREPLTEILMKACVGKYFSQLTAEEFAELLLY
jgi:lipoate-protein ligase A